MQDNCEDTGQWCCAHIYIVHKVALLRVVAMRKKLGLWAGLCDQQDLIILATIERHPRGIASVYPWQTLIEHKALFMLG